MTEALKSIEVIPRFKKQLQRLEWSLDIAELFKIGSGVSYVAEKIIYLLECDICR